jgi:hypothetical protein
MKKWLKVKHSEFLLNKNAAKPDGTPNQALPPNKTAGTSKLTAGGLRMHHTKRDTLFKV